MISSVIIELKAVPRWAREMVRSKVKLDTFFLQAKLRHFPKSMNEFEDTYHLKYRALNASFPRERRTKRDHLDKASLIRKYQQLWLRHKFPFGIPANFLTPEKVVAIIRSPHAKKEADELGSDPRKPLPVVPVPPRAVG